MKVGWCSWWWWWAVWDCSDRSCKIRLGRTDCTRQQRGGSLFHGILAPEIHVPICNILIYYSKHRCILQSRKLLTQLLPHRRRCINRSMHRFQWVSVLGEWCRYLPHARNITRVAVRDLDSTRFHPGTPLRWEGIPQVVDTATKLLHVIDN